MSQSPSIASRGYLGTPGALIHFRAGSPRRAGAQRLVCLHPTPFSSRFYAEFLRCVPALDALATDTPGFGESDPVDEVSIEALAARIATGLETFDSASDLLGFHTGSLLAIELASRFPHLVRRLVLVDAPVLEPHERPATLARTLSAYAIGRTRFEALVARRVAADPFGDDREDARGLELLADEIAGSAAAPAVFKAAFAYAAEKRLPGVAQSALCVATNGPLAAATRSVASALPAGRLVELPEVTAPVFQAHAVAIAEAARPFLE